MGVLYSNRAMIINHWLVDIWQCVCVALWCMCVCVCVYMYVCDAWMSPSVHACACKVLIKLVCTVVVLQCTTIVLHLYIQQEPEESTSTTTTTTTKWSCLHFGSASLPGWSRFVWYLQRWRSHCVIGLAPPGPPEAPSGSAPHLSGHAWHPGRRQSPTAYFLYKQSMMCRFIRYCVGLSNNNHVDNLCTAAPWKPLSILGSKEWCECVCVCVCAHACMHACVCMRVCVCVVWIFMMHVSTFILQHMNSLTLLSLKSHDDPL